METHHKIDQLEKSLKKYNGGQPTSRINELKFEITNPMEGEN